MPRKINFTKHVEAGVDKVYKQISDFENYSTYIPSCSSSKLLEKNDEYEIGELEFNFLLKNYSIKSKNFLRDNSIIIEQIEGPFNFFNGETNLSFKDIFDYLDALKFMFKTIKNFENYLFFIHFWVILAIIKY